MLRIFKPEGAVDFVMQGVEYNPLNEYVASSNGNFIDIFSANLNEYLLKNCDYSIIVDEVGSNFPNPAAVVNYLNTLVLVGSEVITEETLEARDDSVTLIAGQNLSIGQVVQVNDLGEAVLISSTDMNDVNQAFGVTEEAALSGNSVRVKREGKIELPGPLVPENNYFVDAAGNLTNIVPTIGFNQIIGIGISNTTFMVMIRQPVVL